MSNCLTIHSFGTLSRFFVGRYGQVIQVLGHTKSMKILTRILIIPTLLLAASCGNGEMTDELTLKEESQFARDYLQELHGRDFDYVKQYIDQSIENQVTDEKLLEIAEYFPGGDLLSTELIGTRISVSNSQWQGNFSFEYQFSGGWALANVVLHKSGEALSVVGFNVYRTGASQKEINKFSLIGKSAIQYSVLLMAIAVPLFILLTVYFCIRTPIPKKKWLWVLFMLVGFGSISVNWTTGQFGVQPFSIRLFASSAIAAGPFAPWIISASIPLGAILFWFKRQGFIQTSRTNNESISD